MVGSAMDSIQLSTELRTIFGITDSTDSRTETITLRLENSRRMCSVAATSPDSLKAPLDVRHKYWLNVRGVKRTRARGQRVCKTWSQLLCVFRLRC